MEYRKSDYSLRGHNSIDLSNELVEELRDSDLPPETSLTLM